jgi:hypothetical protein
MSDHDDLAQERDAALARDFTDVARQLRRAFREWIQEEVKDLAARADSLEPLLDGVVKTRMQQTTARIRDIDHNELPEATQNLKQKIEEIDDGVYDSLPDGRRHLEEGVSRLEGLVRELLSIRRNVDAMLEAHTHSGE